jgi:photosystem II stability/assembly factor-like uncharacterized protein
MTTLYPGSPSSFNRRSLHAAALCIVIIGTQPVLEADETPDSLTADLSLLTLPESVSCRAIAVARDRGIWVGGSHATLYHSMDNGETWQSKGPAADAQCDYRDVALLPGGRTVIMSAGPGALSRVLISDDDGETWSVTLPNPAADGFFNGMAFLDDGRGVLAGDPIEGRLTVFTTQNGGADWVSMDGPVVAAEEYGFAASGTGVVLDSDGRIGIITGGSRCRFHRFDVSIGRWTSTDIGIRSGNASSGAFSVAFLDSLGIAVGGDYKRPQQAERNLARTHDAGASWEVYSGEMPHKACVLGLSESLWLACGRTGIAVSTDAGITWQQLQDESFYTMATQQDADRAAGHHVVWLAGAEGRVGRLRLSAVSN